MATNKPVKNYPGLNPPAGYKLNPFSNNWIYCPDPKVINPQTGRCVNPDSKTLIVKLSVSSSPKKTSPKSKKKETVIQKILKEYMIEISRRNKLTGKKATSLDKKHKSYSNRKKAKSF